MKVPHGLGVRLGMFVTPFMGEQLEDVFGLISEHSIGGHNEWMEGLATGYFISDRWPQVYSTDIAKIPT